MAHPCAQGAAQHWSAMKPDPVCGALVEEQPVDVDFDLVSDLAPLAALLRAQDQTKAVGATVICADELGPVIPRAFTPHRIRHRIGRRIRAARHPAGPRSGACTTRRHDAGPCPHRPGYLVRPDGSFTRVGEINGSLDSVTETRGPGVGEGPNSSPQDHAMRRIDRRVTHAEMRSVRERRPTSPSAADRRTWGRTAPAHRARTGRSR